MRAAKFIREKVWPEGEVNRHYELSEPLNGHSCLIIAVWILPPSGKPNYPSGAKAWAGASLSDERIFDNKVFDQVGVFTFEQVLARTGYELAA